MWNESWSYLTYPSNTRKNYLTAIIRSKIKHFHHFQVFLSFYFEKLDIVRILPGSKSLSAVNDVFKSRYLKHNHSHMCVTIFIFDFTDFWMWRDRCSRSELLLWRAPQDDCVNVEFYVHTRVVYTGFSLCVCVSVVCKSGAKLHQTTIDTKRSVRWMYEHVRLGEPRRHRWKLSRLSRVTCSRPHS